MPNNISKYLGQHETMQLLTNNCRPSLDTTIGSDKILRLNGPQYIWPKQTGSKNSSPKKIELPKMWAQMVPKILGPQVRSQRM